MRACDRCGHANPDQLAYCFSCGRRLTGRADSGASGNAFAPAGSAGATTNELAATVALSTVGGGIAAGATPSTPRTERVSFFRSGLRSSLDPLRYVFAYVRGRIDAQDLRRRLVEEREGVSLLIEGAFAELGQLVRADPGRPPQLTGLVEAIDQAEARREAAITDLAAAEKSQAADDLRLGKDQAAAEAEWKACDLGAADVEQILRRIDEERREIDIDIARLEREPRTAEGAEPQHRNATRVALLEKRAGVNSRYAALRERAAALRASTVATRTRLDQAVAARRQAAVAMAASLAGHARERNSADNQIRALVIQLGRAATEARLARPDLAPKLAPTTGRIDRLEQILADRDRQIAALERAGGRPDIRKLATGLAIIAAVLVAVGSSLWALAR